MQSFWPLPHSGTGVFQNLMLLKYVLGAFAIWFIGFETRGRTIAEIDSTLTASARIKARAA